MNPARSLGPALFAGGALVVTCLARTHGNAATGADGATTSRGAPKNPLQLGATFWHFRHETRATSPPIWLQNLVLPPLWALARVTGARPYYDRRNGRR